MKKLLFVLSFITLYTYSQEKTNNSKIIIEEIKSCLQFTEKKKVKKENSRKYEYQKGFNAEGWQCIENVISQHVNNFNFQTDWLSEIYLSKKIDTNKLISLRDQLKNETKKKKRNYDYLGVIADKLDQNITNIDLGKVEWEKICLLYTSPSPRDLSTSRMPSSA